MFFTLQKFDAVAGIAPEQMFLGCSMQLDCMTSLGEHLKKKKNYLDIPVVAAVIMAANPDTHDYIY